MTMQNVTDAWCEALFASGLQRSDAPTAEMVAEAIRRAMRQFGIRGCVSRMAQEFGDHPDAAAERMRWIRQLAAGCLLWPQMVTGAGRAGSSAGKPIEWRASTRVWRRARVHSSIATTKPSGGPRHERDM
jgi:hypothetical protein